MLTERACLSVAGLECPERLGRRARVAHADARSAQVASHAHRAGRDAQGALRLVDSRSLSLFTTDRSPPDCLGLTHTLVYPRVLVSDRRATSCSTRSGASRRPDTTKRSRRSRTPTRSSQSLAASSSTRSAACVQRRTHWRESCEDSQLCIALSLCARRSHSRAKKRRATISLRSTRSAASLRTRTCTPRSCCARSTANCTSSSATQTLAARTCCVIARRGRSSVACALSSKRLRSAASVRSSRRSTRCVGATSWTRTRD